MKLLIDRYRLQRTWDKNSHRPGTCVAKESAGSEEKTIKVGIRSQTNAVRDWVFLDTCGAVFR